MFGTNQKYHAKLDQHRKNDFDRVKSDPGCYVEFKIRVVHSVETPKQWHVMEHNVLSVDCEIKDQNREKHFEGWVQIQDVEEAPTSFVHNNGKPYGENRKDEPNNRGIERHG